MLLSGGRYSGYKPALSRGCRLSERNGSRDGKIRRQAAGEYQCRFLDREAQSSPAVGITDDGDGSFGSGMAEGIIDQVADNVR